MNRIFIILFLASSFTLNGQSEKTYEFIDYNLYLTQDVKHNVLSCKRVFLMDSTFKETGIYGIPSKSEMIFNIKSNIWKVKKGRGWKLFFNNGTQVKTTFKNGKSKYKINWERTKLSENGFQIYKLQFNSINFPTSSNPIYYFTSKDGIIAINGHDEFLIRADKIHLNLTDL